MIVSLARQVSFEEKTKYYEKDNTCLRTDCGHHCRGDVDDHHATLRKWNAKARQRRMAGVHHDGGGAFAGIFWREVIPRSSPEGIDLFWKWIESGNADYAGGIDFIHCELGVYLPKYEGRFYSNDER